jgi:Fe-S-cluster containining protein
MDCQCNKCRGACEHKPGWFLPGEAERVADYLGVDLQELFDTRLVVDYWVGDGLDGDTYVLSPGIVGREPGAVLPFDPRGACVFYKNGLCEIHPVKPHECRETMACQPGNENLHQETAMAWRYHQAQIKGLLGKTPNNDCDFFGVFEFVAGMAN